MSNNNWEHATITLPSAEVAPLKRALREHVNSVHDKVRAEALAIHAAVGGTRSVEKYMAALVEQGWAGGFLRHDGKVAHLYAPDRPRRLTVAEKDAQDIRGRALNIFAAMGRRGKVWKPTVADVSVQAPRATASTVEFRGAAEGSIVFEGRVVTWDVPSQNHGVEAARESALGRVFFEGLDRVRWTRDTGGFGVGNSEYNEDSFEPGGGANYTTFTYGPRGEARAAQDVGVSVSEYRAWRARRR